jgi:hypothetical protein
MEARIKMMLPQLDERQRRLFLASEALTYGRGGIAEAMRHSGASRNTIKRGMAELESGVVFDGKVRKGGGGPKFSEERYPDITDRIQAIVDGSTYGDPTRVLSYTTESLRKIQRKLLHEGITVSHVTIAVLLDAMGYSKQSNQKMMQIGEAHPDRDAQFTHINATAAKYIAEKIPVISVDTKKKENIGNFKTDGQEYRRKGDARKVLDHDFPLGALGKVAPYGVYNINDNVGFVNVGVSHDTSEFAVESISRWWEVLGKHTYPNAEKLYINCDGGGSNAVRSRMWKYQLQQFADRTGIDVEVSHFPPGTSKWNKVEHRLFCYISKNWSGKPLIDVQTVVDLIGSTTTTTGLKVTCVRDDTEYELAKKVSDKEFNSINITKIAPFCEWNYRISHRENSQVII